MDQNLYAEHPCGSRLVYPLGQRDFTESLKALGLLPFLAKPYPTQHEATKAIVPSPEGSRLGWVSAKSNSTAAPTNNYHVPRPLGSRLGLCSSHTPLDNIPKTTKIMRRATRA
ncbi:hypothetical protein Tco_1536861, partial [Tanacetum coccineum]